MKRALSIAAAFAIAIVANVSAHAAKTQVIVVPADYHAKQQPPIYGGSFLLTGLQGGSFDDKYQNIYGLLSRDQGLMGTIKKAAALYGVDPVDVLGAIVGEHTYNINVLDTLQDYYVKALEYVSDKSLVFEYRGEKAADFFQRPQFAKCDTLTTNYGLWDCRETVWNQEFSGRSVGGRSYPHTRLNLVFFQPMFAGQTFGVGQIGPVAALMVTDLVHKKSGLPLLTIDDAPGVFQQIMNPDTSIQYIAASIRVSIDNYKQIAGFDISKNAGLTATLYNLGDSATRAAQLKATNDALAAAGKPPQYPQENFYGWFVNDKIDDLRNLVTHTANTTLARR